LGYLLHKNPAKLHSFELSFGKAHVFYPEATSERCTAALLLDVDPIGLVRGKRGQHEGGTLDQYVNDGPYVLSSFLSVAMGRAFGTAMSGRSKGRQELADRAIPLTANLTVVACRAGEGLIRELFEPLGYSVTAEHHPLDEKFPEWREGPYYSVTLAGTLRLQDLLNHLYVLIPVLDAEKHYWIGNDEVEKLLRKGEGWLASHPHKEAIVKRYLPRQRQLAREALARLAEEDNPDPDATEEAHSEEETKMEEPIRLWQQRMGAVVAVLRSVEAKRVLDLGCGEGKLLRALLDEKSLTEIVGMDVSYRSLEIASQRLRLDRMPTKQRERLKLMHGSLMYRDKRLAGYDAATVVEVIEHLDAPRLAAFERVLFEAARPKTIIVTTPNCEYNVKFETLPAGKFRHKESPLRMDSGRIPAVVTPNLRTLWVRSKVSAGRGRRSPSRCAHANGGLQLVNITIPELSLVVLIGPLGCGKSSLAREHFKSTEVLSSDFCRGLVSDDDNSQEATNDAFDVLHYVARKRLAAGRLTVVDATNVQPEARKPLVALAREFHVLPVAIVLNLPEKVCHERNQSRSDRQFGPHVIRNQSQQLRRSLRGLEREGFRHVFVLSSPEEVSSVAIVRQPLWNNLKREHGPFDIIGDVHGCYEELTALLVQLGYKINEGPTAPSDQV
jgi:3' terminal RNA ribose 2'-O-methyltransferase Hen1